MRNRIGLIALACLTGCGNGDKPSGAVQPIVAQDQPKAEPPKPRNKIDPPASGEFVFPADEGGKILGRILPPQAPALDPFPGKTASERALPPFVASPTPPSSTASLSPPRVPQPDRVAVRPSPLPDRVPYELAQRDLERPEITVFPVGALTKIDALDVNRPADLPILARPTPDRAPLDDPTAEFTARSIINNNLPLRVTMALFVKVNLPEPFEYAEQAKVKVVLPEDPAKALGNPPLPRP